MDLMLANPETDSLITRIKKDVRLSMNGVAADSMKSHGLNYKQNFGVSIPRLKEIASAYEPDKELARQLWHLKIRETMILATILQPTGEFSRETASEWMRECNNQELIEQANMNLYRHLPYAPEFALECIVAEATYTRIFGFTLATRLAKSLTEDQIKIIVQQGIDSPEDSPRALYTSIGACFASLCRRDKETAASIYTLITGFDNKTEESRFYIFQSVRQELIFLDLLTEEF